MSGDLLLGLAHCKVSEQIERRVGLYPAFAILHTEGVSFGLLNLNRGHLPRATAASCCESLFSCLCAIWSKAAARRKTENLVRQTSLRVLSLTCPKWSVAFAPLSGLERDPGLRPMEHPRVNSVGVSVSDGFSVGPEQETSGVPNGLPMKCSDCHCRVHGSSRPAKVARAATSFR